MIVAAARLLGLRIAAHWIAAPQSGVDGSGKSPEVNGKGWQRSPLRSIVQLTASYHPGYNLGIHCGYVENAISLIFADLDGPNAIEWADKNLPATPLKTITRKGEHRGYLHPGKEHRIASGGIYANVNGQRVQIGHVRADGGNVVCAPSIHESGFLYQESVPWTAELLAQVPYWPNAIILDPWRSNLVVNGDSNDLSKSKVDNRSKTWAQTALDELTAELASAAQGNRNHTLNGVAYRAGRLVAGGHIDRSTVERRLSHSAESSGLNTSEIRKSLQSGLNAGTRHPHPGPSDKQVREAKPTTYICAAILKHGAIALGTATPDDFSDPLEKSFVKFIQTTDPSEFEQVPEAWDALRTTVAQSLEYVEQLIASRPPPIPVEIFNENPILPHTNIQFQTSAAPDDSDFRDENAVRRDLLPSISHNELAIEMLNRITVQSGYKPIWSEGNFWKYQDGIWEKHTPDMIALDLDNMPWGTKTLKGGGTVPLGHFCLRKTDLVGILDIAKRRVLQDEFFSGLPGIGFENGFAQIAEHGIILREHSPFYRARHRYSFAYNPDWQCTKWGRTLGQLFANNKDAEDRKKVLQEFAGACLTGQATKYARFLVLTGKPGCGKSVVFQVLRAIFPDHSVSSVAPQDMGIEYRRVAIVGKLLNCRDDINESNIAHVGDFKNAVTGGTLQVRDVGEKQYDTKPIAGHMVAFNNTPRFHDPSGAFTDRILAIEFSRRFRGTNDDNPHLVDEILQEEKDQIVAWALEGAWRLWYQGGYTIPASSIECAERWSSSNDPVQKFVDDKLDTRAGQVKLTEVYEAYKKWAKSCGYDRLLDLHAFSRNLGNHAIVNGDFAVGKLL